MGEFHRNILLEFHNRDLKLFFSAQITSLGEPNQPRQQPQNGSDASLGQGKRIYTGRGVDPALQCCSDCMLADRL